MNVRYRVELNQCERDQLIALLSGGKRGTRKLKRAQILLAANRGASDEEIAEASASAALPYTEPNAVLCSATWRRRSMKSRARARAVSLPAKRKPCWSRRPVFEPARRALALDLGAFGQ